MYAEGTSVSVAKSRSEIIGMLSDRGVENYLAGQENGIPFVVFTYDGISFKLSCPKPDPKRCVSRRARRSVAEQLEQEERRLWRVLTMIVKAKIVAIDEGLSTFTSEFLSGVVTGPSTTLLDTLTPALESARNSGGVLALGGRT